jgi:hypothetical protein
MIHLSAVAYVQRPQIPQAATIPKFTESIAKLDPDVAGNTNQLPSSTPQAVILMALAAATITVESFVRPSKKPRGRSISVNQSKYGTVHAYQE